MNDYSYPKYYSQSSKASLKALIVAALSFHDQKDLEELIVAYRNGGPIKVKDIAEVEDGLED
ncbi:hypothetical protein EBR25_14110, partial [bacterium]|nr:hypothetical protein [bacterium]